MTCLDIGGLHQESELSLKTVFNSGFSSRKRFSGKTKKNLFFDRNVFRFFFGEFLISFSFCSLEFEVLATKGSNLSTSAQALLLQRLLLRLYHCSYSTAVVALLLQLCSFSTALVVMLLQHCCYCTVVAALLLYHCCCSNAAVALLLLHCCCSNGFVAMQLQQCCCSTVIVSQSW